MYFCLNCLYANQKEICKRRLVAQISALKMSALNTKVNQKYNSLVPL